MEFTPQEYAYLDALVNDQTHPYFTSFEKEHEYYRKRSEQLYLENPERYEAMVRKCKKGVSEWRYTKNVE